MKNNTSQEMNTRQIKQISIDKHELLILLPHAYTAETGTAPNGTRPDATDPGGRYPIIYVMDGDVLKDVIMSFTTQVNIDAIIVGIVPVNRMSEYTPWQATALSSRFSDFGGEGDAFLCFLEEKLIPYMCENYNATLLQQRTMLLGYSLGGLMGIYSLFRLESFGAVASVSGSFWYPDWTGFVTENAVRNKTAHILISSGTDEGRGAKDIKRNAAEATVQTYDALCGQYPEGNVKLEWNNYSHHKQIALKVHTALLWLCEKCK